jgi:hypothetical protein
MALAGSQALAAGGEGSSVVVVGGTGKDNDFKFVQGVARVPDGTLTVGQVESVVVKRFPRRSRLSAYVEPASDPICDQRNPTCFPQPLFRPAGTPRFKASGKGRAVLTFVMPPAFELFNQVDPTQSHPVQFTDGELVEVEVTSIGRTREGRRRVLTFGVAAVTAHVQLLPPS